MKDYYRLHFIVLLWGFTGILGKLISLPATALVSYRMLLAAVGIGIFLWWRGKSFRLSFSLLWQTFFVGFLIMLHWVTFFGAIKISNISVTLGCMATLPLFTSLLEPIFNRRQVRWLEVGLSIVAIGGLYIITQFAFHFYWGIILALCSAFLSSLFGLFNQQLVKKHSEAILGFYEMLFGCLLLLGYRFVSGQAEHFITEISATDALYLLILALVCTAYPFVTSIKLLRRLSAFSISLAINLEPVYSIVLAYLIFGDSEYMHLGFYWGALMLIASVFAYPILRRRWPFSA